jgi:glycine cleavage system H protein
MALSFPDDCRYADPEVGAAITAGQSFGSVESVKAVEDLMAPVSGVVEARNEAVLSDPETLQNDPYGEGWLLLVRPSDAAAADTLMDADRYRAKVEGA